MIIAATIIAGCGSTPQKTVVKQVSTTPQISVESKPTLEQLLTKANESESPIPALVEITILLSQSDCSKTIQVAEVLRGAELSPIQLNQILFIGGKCLFERQQFYRAEQWLSLLPNDASWLKPKHEILYTIYEQKKLWWETANAYYYVSSPSLETETTIWHLLSKLPTVELQQHAKEISNIQHLATLMLIQRHFTIDYELAKTELQQWLAGHPNHVFNESLPESLEFIVSDPLLKGSKIAVLLPLSGPREAQGDAVKEGILAASFSQNVEDRTFTFLDTNTWSKETLPELGGFDLIVGPLLKQNIDLISGSLPENIPVLNLNRSDLAIQRSNHFFFSLAPEDEARQLAVNLLEQGYTSPFVITNQSSAYQRMKTVFVETWQTALGKQPNTLDFNETKDIRKGVNDNLSLSASKSRINQIKNMLKKQLHTMERNRRDIDVIVILANTTHTELINPLIEASTSPFAEIIPVYASSRSHSRTNSKNDLRDLRNLQFLDMPWMLPSREYSWLQNFSRELWPERRDNLNRLFAMGYDAMNILPYLPLLQKLPNQSWEGLTGKIKVDENGLTKRTSHWAKFTEERVVTLEHN